jgi:DNA-binding CsgD family transcriptional regulator
MSGYPCQDTQAQGSNQRAASIEKRFALSGRETDVLRCLSIGKSNKETSMSLGISIKTVETYRWRLMMKTQARTVAQLVHYAIRHGIIEIQE